MDENDFSCWSVTGPDSIEINGVVDTRQFRIVTGYTSESKPAPAAEGIDNLSRLDW